MEKERIWTLIAHKLAGESSATELVELYDLLKENPEVHYSLEVFDQLWKENPFAQHRPVAAYVRMLRRMEQQGIQFPAGDRSALYQQLTPVGTRQKQMPKLFMTGLMIGNSIKISWRKLFRKK